MTSLCTVPNNLDATDYAEKSRLESAGFDTDFAK